MGLPGGMNHPNYVNIEVAAKSRGLFLVKGKGDDGDTLGRKIVYVMDSTAFPFHQGELYHQYHNDFLTPA